MSVLTYLADTNVVHIATRTGDGREILTPIWAVVIDTTAYIRNGFGADSRWYRRAVRNGNVAFADGTRRYPVTLEPTTPELLESVDQAYRAKYTGQSGLAEVTAEPARSNTLRVHPS